ncbi:MAG: DNA mismatch repair endonuclease MutL [Phycisphaerae bacterium]
MPTIRVLPPGLVNRIAAGECVERPSSVVKELVENSLDAGAARVRIELLDGGRELIQVADDGVGMSPDDLRLSIEPHATSKIRDDEDLYNIRSLGFRGEALASIGSVARLEIVSRPRDSDIGHRIRVDAGVVDGPAPCAAPPGTCVAVRDLFYCVPARRKFLRTNPTEMGHVGEQLARIALAATNAAFTLSHQKRVSQRLEATSDPRTRIADLFGQELAAVLLPISRESGGVRVRGLVAPPAEGRGSGKWEYVFVNGRYVRDKFVSHAIKEAYRSLIDPSRYPVVFLHIDIDPAAVDVNVHPSKIEVRWRDSNFVHGQVLAALREKFLQTNLDRRLRAPAAEDEHREQVRAAMVDFFTGRGRNLAESQAPPTPAWTRSDQARAGRAGAPARFESQEAESFPTPPAMSDHAWDVARSARSAPRDDDSLPPERGNSSATSDDAVASDDARWRAARINESSIEFPVAKPRAIQLHRAYLVVESEDGLLVIDQHALHERILYEQIARRVAQRPLESQRMLLPEAIPVPSDRHEALELHAETLLRLGIELTVSGPNSVTLHAFPSFLERLDRVQFVSDLLDKLAERGARPERDSLLHELLDMMACKAAVKAGDPLTPDEIDALLSQRELAERSSNCPHGRPTTLRFSLSDLERQFKRR